MGKPAAQPQTGAPCPPAVTGTLALWGQGETSGGHAGGRRATLRCRGSKATLTPDRLLDIAPTAACTSVPGLAALVAGACRPWQRH